MQKVKVVKSCTGLFNEYVKMIIHVLFQDSTSCICNEQFKDLLFA